MFGIGYQLPIVEVLSLFFVMDELDTLLMFLLLKLHTALLWYLGHDGCCFANSVVQFCLFEQWLLPCFFLHPWSWEAIDRMCVGINQHPWS